MAILKYRDDAPKAHILAARGFKDCGARELRADGVVAEYRRKNGNIIALSYENEFARYVVWSIDETSRAWTTFYARQDAIAHAIHCAEVIYR